MNKVITIHLNGRAYQLEEGGYDALRAYLDEAQARLAADPGKSEIIADIEQAIAEKCEQLLNPHKTVVLASEIQTILAAMGPVEGSAKETGDGEKKEDVPRAPKRLYLIQEGALIAGVCTGLAAYFDLDVILVRAIFVGLTILTGGGWILLYIALALLVPRASTSEERAAAHGMPFNAQELVNRAKQHYDHFANNKHEWKKWKHDMKRKAKQWKYQHHSPPAYSYRASPLLGVLTGLIAVVWILALLSLITTGAIFGWLIPAGIPIWIAVILLFILYHAVTGPIKGARYSNNWGGGQAYYYSEWDGLGDGLTVLFLAIAFGWAYLHFPQVQDFIKNLPEATRQAIAELKQWWQH